MKPSPEGSWTVVLPFHVIPDSVGNKFVTMHAYWKRFNKRMEGEPNQHCAGMPARSMGRSCEVSLRRSVAPCQGQLKIY